MNKDNLAIKNTSDLPENMKAIVDGELQYRLDLEKRVTAIEEALMESGLLPRAQANSPSQETESSIPYSERELIQRAIKSNAADCIFGKPMPRWVLVKHVFLTGQHVSRAICTKYGFDPDKEVGAFTDG